MKCANCEKLQAQLNEAYAILSHNMKIANGNAKRARTERDHIIRKLREKHSCIEIAEQFGLTRQRVHQILNEPPIEGSVHGEDNGWTQPGGSAVPVSAQAPTTAPSPLATKGSAPSGTEDGPSHP